MEFTNRDWLNKMSNEELVDYLLSKEFAALKSSYTNTRLGLIEWLAAPHVELPKSVIIEGVEYEIVRGF